MCVHKSINSQYIKFSTRCYFSSLEIVRPCTVILINIPRLKPKSSSTDRILIRGISPLKFIILNIVDLANYQVWYLFELKFSDFSRQRLFENANLQIKREFNYNLGFFKTETFLDLAKIIEIKTFSRISLISGLGPKVRKLYNAT